MSDPPQYIPVGEVDTENSVFVDRGYNRANVHINALGWHFLSTALKSNDPKEQERQEYLAPVPRREKRGRRSLRGTALKRRGLQPTSPDVFMVLR